MNNERRYLSSDAFSALSETEKREYAAELGERIKTALTYEDKSEILAALFAMGAYPGAQKLAQELEGAANEQLEADAVFRKRKRRIGAAVISAVVVLALLAALAVVFIELRGAKDSGTETAALGLTDEEI